MNIKSELVKKKEQFLLLKNKYTRLEKELEYYKNRNSELDKEKNELKETYTSIETLYYEKYYAYYDDKNCNNRFFKNISFILLCFACLISYIVVFIGILLLMSPFTPIISILGGFGESIILLCEVLLFNMSAKFITDKLWDFEDKIFEKFDKKFELNEENIIRKNEVIELEKSRNQIYKKIREIDEHVSNVTTSIKNITEELQNVKNLLFNFMYPEYELNSYLCDTLSNESDMNLTLK